MHFKNSKLLKSVTLTTGLLAALLATGNMLPASAEQAVPQSTQTFYVSPSGNDNNPGTLAKPFKTLGFATWNPKTLPGCALCVMDGTYNEYMYISHGGNANTPTGYVTYYAQHGGQAKIVPPTSCNGSAIYIDADYVVVQGFDVSGGGPTCSGINASQPSMATGHHHVQILSNLVHDLGSGGILAVKGDWFNVAWNYIWNTASNDPGQCSGISLLTPYPFPAGSFTPSAIDNSSGYHNIILGNNSSHNVETWAGTHTDGNGIILDTFGLYPYTGRTLVTSNVTAFNGGRGIEVFNNVNAAANTVAPADVINNTSYCNGQDLNATFLGSYHAELLSYLTKYVNWKNNIAYSVAGAPGSVFANNICFQDDQATGSNPTTNWWYHNIGYNPTAGTQNNSGMYVGPANSGVISNANNLFSTNPKFANVAGQNYHLTSGSPAIGYGLTGAALSIPYTPTYTQDGLLMPSPPNCGAFNSQ